MSERTLSVRRANPKEFGQIFMMGYDVWAEGMDEQAYLESCHASPKYAKGNWYVLEMDKHLLSSLIVYKFSNSIYGIGSIATFPVMRRRGYATQLLSDAINQISRSTEDEPIYFLYSDVKPDFYEKVQFRVIPGSVQKYLPSVCMVRPASTVLKIEKGSVAVPPYF